MKVFPATEETFESMKGLDFIPAQGEGVIYIKLVALKPNTIKVGDPKKITDDAQGVVVCGNLDEIKSKLNEWFGSLSQEYQNGQ